MMSRMISLALVSFTSLAVAGCNDYPGTSTADTNRPTAQRPAGTTPPVAPDNTGANRPEVATSDKTPFDQSEKQGDISITAEIRRNIMSASDMSANAQNCKIMTENGVVTLRGPVASQAEKDSIGALAANVPGVTRVDNLLEVRVGGA